jgi:hypothetical protein
MDFVCVALEKMMNGKKPRNVPTYNLKDIPIPLVLLLILRRLGEHD